MAVGMEGRYRNRTRITLYHMDRRATTQAPDTGRDEGKE